MWLLSEEPEQRPRTKSDSVWRGAQHIIGPYVVKGVGGGKKLLLNMLFGAACSCQPPY